MDGCDLACRSPWHVPRPWRTRSSSAHDSSRRDHAPPERSFFLTKLVGARRRHALADAPKEHHGDAVFSRPRPSPSARSEKKEARWSAPPRCLWPRRVPAASHTPMTKMLPFWRVEVTECSTPKTAVDSGHVYSRTCLRTCSRYVAHIIGNLSS